MSDKLLSMDTERNEKIYSILSTAKLARVTVEFIRDCERENLIQIATLRGSKGYGHDTVRRLIRIRHLHYDLGLDLTAIDCILRMRRQIAALQKQIHDTELRMLQREQEMLGEITRLRRQLARDCAWEDI